MAGDEREDTVNRRRFLASALVFALTPAAASGGEHEWPVLEWPTGEEYAWMDLDRLLCAPDDPITARLLMSTLDAYPIVGRATLCGYPDDPRYSPDNAFRHSPQWQLRVVGELGVHHLIPALAAASPEKWATWVARHGDRIRAARRSARFCDTERRGEQRD